MTLQHRIDNVEARIQAACTRSGRSREDVHVIAVTKYVSLDVTGAAIQAGLTHIGENRWQDAEEKWNSFHSDATWHFIGSLQSKKAKDVVGKFPYIHSLDRVSLAEAIEKRASSLQTKVRCFIQVNISGEQTKQGLAPDEVKPFLEQLREYPHIVPFGFMTMAPYEAEPEDTRPVFRGLRQLRDEINHNLSEPIQHLSMGMSNDFEVAIEEGATWVRLGSILVGKEGE
ncbi:YggS family pyridoxal phosphate-dependent enzyme [Paenibacillus sp. ACRRX]|uniref:YggS family pyridoxal phosphate-dependent enzyme n=1 Tax=unclassified Paenibacillus TaxID=185978 RepID=UPI001EF4D82F|nr:MULTISPECIES: YggS family pyridoxal phosphate-dependent enzyme [unclassified Paenibacillus]MCG7407785.1 YggS family pyridoxal phosphate-dependent enzyme [Paenibacillus sp. ACRRX]MDK8180929.1 YggS family pyridoxal phosphate-dependent enzyme [Paenibacillus sp. UMB4589-SE434]